jgi:phosphinothricin acetyltransferase
MSAIGIRDSRADDIAAIHAIYAHHVRHGLGSFEEVPPDAEDLGRRRADILARGLPYVVATLDGAVVGYAYVGPYRTRSAYRFTLEDSVYVAAGHAGRGIGKSLLAELLRRSEGLGYRQMIAVIGDSANQGSIRLHRALGFTECGLLRSVGFKFGRWVDSVLMQRPLGGADATPLG